MNKGFNSAANKAGVKPSCFVAGTLVMAVAGMVAIEKIKSGDKVISTDPETMETSPKTVLETYIREVTTLVHLTVNGEEIVTTVDHPFYVKNQGFIKAGELIVGDELLDVNGNILLVENFAIELTEKPVTVYNFQVEDFHTYFVGTSQIMVHNSDCGIQENGYVDAKKIAEDPSEFTGKDVNDYAREMKEVGYECKIKSSTRSRSGAQKVVVENCAGNRNIAQLQVSPGGGRHGSQPYVKISTTDQGIIKIVTGSEASYLTDGMETATIIFTEG